MTQKKKRYNIYNSQEGATAVEFALIAPILALLMFAIIDIGMVMFAKGVLENATFTAARTGKTGFIADGNTQEETILALLNQRAGALLDTSKINMTSVSYSEFDDIGQPEPFIDANGNGTRDIGENYTDVNLNSQYDTDMGASGQGSTSEVVVYTVNYPWSIYTPMVAAIIGENGIVNLTSRIVVQNEPY